MFLLQKIIYPKRKISDFVLCFYLQIDIFLSYILQVDFFVFNFCLQIYASILFLFCIVFYKA